MLRVAERKEAGRPLSARSAWAIIALAERDDEGYLSIVGRRKEVIRTGGETVAPAEVEAMLSSHPAVAEAAVVGLPDAPWGELVCAVGVVHPGADAPTVADLRAHIGDRLAPFKHPRRVVTVDQLPRTSATGQIQRAAVQKAVVREAGAREAVARAAVAHGAEGSP